MGPAGRPVDPVPTTCRLRGGVPQAPGSGALGAAIENEAADRVASTAFPIEIVSRKRRFAPRCERADDPANALLCGGVEDLLRLSLFGGVSAFLAVLLLLMVLMATAVAVGSAASRGSTACSTTLNAATKFRVDTVVNRREEIVSDAIAVKLRRTTEFEAIAVESRDNLGHPHFK